MAYEALIQRHDLHRIILEEHSEGTYIFVFRQAGSPRPDEDQLQDDVEMAMRVCKEDYGVTHDRSRHFQTQG